MSVESEAFLAHVGVKGMKWGKRKARDKSSSNQNGSKSPRQPMSRKKKVAIGVGVGVAAVGTAAVLYSLNKNMKLPVSSLRNNPSTTAGREIFTSSVASSAPTGGSGLSLGSASRFAGKSVPAPKAKLPVTPRINTPELDRQLKKYGPSLSALDNIMKNAPSIVFDSATGQYITRGGAY